MYSACRVMGEKHLSKKKPRKITFFIFSKAVEFSSEYLVFTVLLVRSCSTRFYSKINPLKGRVKKKQKK